MVMAEMAAESAIFSKIKNFYYSTTKRDILKIIFDFIFLFAFKIHVKRKKYCLWHKHFFRFTSTRVLDSGQDCLSKGVPLYKYTYSTSVSMD